ncbi:hypothetical protein JCM11251_000197 [Rhodosporidiobolus azoricus]
MAFSTLSRLQRGTAQKGVTHLTLLNSSFRPNSHTSPPSLGPFLSSLTSLTLANLGLPPPTTHLTSLLSACAGTLQHLAVSSLRDVGRDEFRRAVAILAEANNKGRGRGPLKSLTLGFLTDAQLDALTLPLLSSCSDTPSSPLPVSLASSLAPSLSTLPLTHLTLTLPLPTLPLLFALPPSLTILTIRPPYSRSSSTLFGTDKASLLSALARVRAGRGRVETPLQSAVPTPAPGTPTRRRPSVTLEQLEEEESALLALEEALTLPPCACPSKGKELLSPDSVLAPRLEKIRWECRAMRCAEERVRSLVEGRKEWMARVYGREE